MAMKLSLHPLAAALMLAGCASRPPAPPPPPEPQLFQWYGDGLVGRTRVVINLASQRANVTIGGQPAGWAVVATGKEGFRTPAGHYTVLEKVVDKHSTLYGWIEDDYGNVIDPDADIRKVRVPAGARFVHAPMPYWMRLTWRGIGMHAGVIPQPGSPASHGCIRLPKEFAPILFDRVAIGTPVTIVR
jgi:lipoprotein-anchoring transpeptidase ErfK/SrfK